MNNIVAFPGIHIEPFSDKYVDACSAFLHKSWHQNYTEILPPDIVAERTQQTFRQYLMSKQGLCWAAFAGERVVGLLSVSSNCVEDLWVDEKFKRRNIGSQLLEIALQHFKQKGFQNAQVGCESFNHDLTRFLSAKGWRQIGSQPINVTPDMPVEALVFATAL